MHQANVHGIVNGDRIRRGDLRGHVTGIWEGRYIQVLWNRPGIPLMWNSDGFTAEEARRFRREGEVWIIET